MAALTPDNLYFLYENMDELENLFPNDELLRAHIESLRTVLRANPAEDDPQYCKTLLALRSHVSETYKLHRRILRNRRSNVTDITPSRVGVSRLNYESEHTGALIEALEAWRNYVANQFYNRQESDEYKSLAELHWNYIEYLMSDINKLAIVVQARLNMAEDGDINPLFENEDDYLRNILDNATLAANEQSKMSAVITHLRNIRDNQKVVIFCSAPTMADTIFQSLQNAFLTHNVVRHSLEHNNWEAFKTNPHVRYLICDHQAEEGLNLQGGNRVLLHYDIPLSPNRLEQRTGRLDRYGVGDISTIVPVCENNDYETRWLRCLDKGFGIFNTSIASLQYLIEAKMQDLKLEVMNSGFQSLDNLLNELQGENGIVRAELRNISHQDNLDALSNERDDQFLMLEDYDCQWETIKNDIDAWIEQKLHFIKTPHHVEEPPPPDFIFRYKFDLTRTLMPVDDFAYNCSAAIDNQYMTYPYTFSRKTSYKRKLRLLRFGDDFLRGIMRVANRDDSGKSFAMWRHVTGWENPIQLFYRFDFIIEADLSMAKKIIRKHEHTTEQALHRLGDLFFPPMTHTVWLNEAYGQVTIPNTLEILNRGYNREFDKNINFKVWDWLLTKNLHYWQNWSRRCFTARREAEQILKTNEEFNNKIEKCLQKAQEISQRNLSQLRSRCYRLNRLEYDIENDRLQLDEGLYEALFEGIRNPSVRCDSTGVVFLSKHNIREGI